MTTVTYLDHSGFAVTTPQAIMVFDYFKDPDRKLEHVLNAHKHLPVVFFVSHSLNGHFDTSIFELGQNRHRTYVLSNSVDSHRVPQGRAEVAWMSGGDAIETVKGTKRIEAFHTVDKGVCFVVTTPEGKLIFHGGDMNNWHENRKTTENEIQKDEAKLHSTIYQVAEQYPKLDIAFFSVDSRLGADFAKGATTFLEKIQVGAFFPINFYGEPDPAADFASYVPAAQVPNCHYLNKPGQSVELQ